VPQTQVYATTSGVLVCGVRTAWVDLGSRKFERELVALLRTRSPFDSLYRNYSRASVDRAVGALADAGVLQEARSDSPVIVLAFEKIVEDRPPPGFDPTEGPSRPDERTIYLVSPDDSSLDAALVRASERNTKALVIWWSGSEVVAVLHDGRRSQTRFAYISFSNFRRPNDSPLSCKRRTLRPERHGSLSALPFRKKHC